MKNVIYSVLLAVGLLGIVGCGSEEEQTTGFQAPSVPKTKEKAAEVITREFATSSAPAAKKNADLTAKALQSGDYEKAAVGLYSLQASAKTYEQQMAVRQSLIRMQMDLARAIENGDPRAKAAAELMKRRSSGGR